MRANHRIRSRSTLHRLARANSGIGWNDGGAGGGGAADKKDDADKKDPTADKKDDAKPEAKYTDADVDARVAAAVAEDRRKADAKAAKEKADAEAEEAKKRGEFETVAQKETERADKAEAEARDLRRSIALRDHLAEKHPDYINAAKYIAPLIPGDADGDELPKAIEKAAAEFVKDNPREVKGGTGAPGNSKTPPRQDKREGEKKQDRHVLPNGNRLVSPASRF